MRSFFKLKYIVILIVSLDIAMLGRLGIVATKCSIPDQILLFQGRESTYNFALPVSMTISDRDNDINELYINGNLANNDSDVTNSMSFTGADKGECHAKVNLLGLINIKEIDIQVKDSVEVYPVGKCSGIYIKTDGIMVLGIGSVKCEEGVVSQGISQSPALNIVKAGDYILKVNHNDINSFEDMEEYIENSDNDKIILTLRRNQEIMDVAVNRVKDVSGDYKIGVWVRENLQGIGTITYVDEDGNFGALGHGISDSVNNITMEIESGELYKPYIKDIIKGRRNNPGELYGTISYAKEDYLGQILVNKDNGIYGCISEDKLKDLLEGIKKIPIKLKDEIEKGPAKIICNVENERREYYVEIEQINMNGDNKKNMIIKITDEELLEKTNGIVQGMSGSPIIQDGKLIGAVTHVFVDDPTRGYGIFIEEMID